MTEALQTVMAIANRVLREKRKFVRRMCGAEVDTFVQSARTPSAEVDAHTESTLARISAILELFALAAFFLASVRCSENPCVIVIAYPKLN